MKLPEMQELRRERPELDEELREMEDENRRRLAKYDWKDSCYGVLIAHEGVEAVEAAPVGQTTQQCSRGVVECRGLNRPHAMSNVSCRILMPPCPMCDSEEGAAGEPRG